MFVSVTLEHSTLLLCQQMALLGTRREHVAKEQRYEGIQNLMVTMANTNRRRHEL